MRANRVRIKLLLLLGSLLVGLLLAEAMVRLFVAEPEISQVARGRYRLSADPKIGYEPIPNMGPIAGSKLQNYDYSHSSNSLGFRDVEHETSILASVKRVIIIGDSVTAGTGVLNLDKIFARLVDKALGNTVDVMNFGVTGYNTEQEVETLRVKGLKFTPDVVVVAFCLT